MSRLSRGLIAGIGMLLAIAGLAGFGVELHRHGEVHWAAGILPTVFVGFGCLLIDFDVAAKPFRLLADLAVRLWTRTPPQAGS